MHALAEFLDDNRERHLEELAEYLAIPSISALPEHAADLQRCAEWTAGALRRIGLERVRVIETPGHPIVYGEWLHAPGAPTVLIYGHYDVQPVDPLDQWESPPFEATVCDGKLYARGATDDKGQFFTHVKAIEAHLATAGRLPVNVKVLVEGEEEIGGRYLQRFVCANADLLRADVVVISDSAMFAAGVPSIDYALRGLACFQVDVRGSASDLHSGSFGGTVANPAFVLAQLLAQCKDGAGRVTIPGFYDAVRPLTAGEREELARLPFDESAYRAQLGAPALFGEAGYSTLERLWARPTFEVNGLHAGFAGEGMKTVIPATAMAKVSMRLVPDQDPDRIGALFEAHVAAIAPAAVAVTITRAQSGPPWAERPDDPYLQAARRAMVHGFGTDPVFTREGGSNPIVPTFQRVLGVPTVMFGLGLPTDNAHAPNEHLHVANFHQGVVAAARLYEELAAVRPPAPGGADRPS